MQDLEFEHIDTNTYKIKPLPGMKADAIFYAKQEMLPLVGRDRSLMQLAQTAMLPHLLSPVIAMPDMHEGYGIPVGGIMVSEKIVSAGCVGMDINCGVRLLSTGVDYDVKLFDARGLREIIQLIETSIPVGLGGGYKREHPGISFGEVVLHGSKHLLKQGYGEPEDSIHCEEEGEVPGADPAAISPKAERRARKQLGTLGSGNHFIEVQKVTDVFDQKTAKVFGITEGLVCIMLHSGSRALGHQTCIDYTNLFYKLNSRHNPDLVPNHNLASALVESEEGKSYLAAMNGSINFAFANRQMLTHQLRANFEKYMKRRNIQSRVEVIYDIAHNSAKWEIHRGKRVLVHRKGATRALPPGHPDNPKTYATTGHPAFVPGSMGTGSYILVGTRDAEKTYFSVNHGAGRSMSRTQAKQTITESEFKKQMGSVIYNKPFRVISDEAPAAYKDLDLVIKTLEEAGVTRRLARLQPLAVVKGD